MVGAIFFPAHHPVLYSWLYYIPLPHMFASKALHAPRVAEIVVWFLIFPAPSATLPGRQASGSQRCEEVVHAAHMRRWGVVRRAISLGYDVNDRTEVEGTCLLEEAGVGDR